MLSRIHITGASGAGVSTLGAALAARWGLAQIDTDDVFWVATHPPYQLVRPREQRVAMLDLLFAEHPRWVLSGSVGRWADGFVPRFELVVFVVTPTPVRLERLRAREARNLGALIEPGGEMHQEHLEFLDWAAAYDDPTFDGRSRHDHEAWLATLPCPVLRLDGETPTARLVEEVEAFVRELRT